MEPDRWNRAGAIFLQACDIDPEERHAFVKTECKGDRDLETLIMELLAADDSGTTYLDAVPEIPSVIPSEADEYTVKNDRIGPYKIIRELGRGGMGVVYLVERADRQFNRQMALKLVRKGMDTDEIIQRFQYERQILASLEHPNIARLHDGGVAGDGRPWFAMEYVEGEPISTFCDNRRLSVSKRIELFKTVCRGVQYAHQHLIVHRDLKPSNILVTAGGEVRLLDFGIAKLLQKTDDPDHPVTRPMMRFITSAYASPEQKRGGPLSTASDVYSLGVIMYELLTGSLPAQHMPEFSDQDSLPKPPGRQIAATTREDVFINRGTTRGGLQRLLKNDLNAITVTALHPDPQFRYQSAEQLLLDLERFTGGRPVKARPPSKTYRFRKFIVRNRVAAGSGMLIMLLTLIFALFTWMQARETIRERDKAEQVSEFLEEMLSAADPAFGTDRADTLRIKDFVTKSTQRVRQDLAGQPAVQAKMLNILGNVHQKLGMYEESQTLLDEALNLRTNLFGDRHAETAESKNDLGVVLGLRGDTDAAEAMIRDALNVRRSHFGTDHETVANSLTDLANLVHAGGNYDEAEHLYRQALNINRNVHGEYHRKTATSLLNLATIMQRKGNLKEGENLHREAMVMLISLFGDDHLLVASAANNLGVLLMNRGAPEEARHFVQQAYTIRRTVYGDIHPEVLTSMNNLASLHLDLGEFDKAGTLYRESLVVARKLHGEHSIEVVTALNNLAALLWKTEAFDEAISMNRDAVAVAEQALGSGHPAVGIISGNLASKLRERGAVSEALSLYTSSLALLSGTLPPDHPSTARQKLGLGTCYFDLKDYAKAEPLMLEAYATFLEKNLNTELVRTSLTALYEAWDKPDLALQYSSTESEIISSE
jgi:eukaryotic-like serine/threonine-protein kinase